MFSTQSQKRIVKIINEHFNFEGATRTFVLSVGVAFPRYDQTEYHNLVIFCAQDDTVAQDVANFFEQRFNELLLLRYACRAARDAMQHAGIEENQKFFDRFQYMLSCRARYTHEQEKQNLLEEFELIADISEDDVTQCVSFLVEELPMIGGGK